MLQNDQYVDKVIKKKRKSKNFLVELMLLHDQCDTEEIYKNRNVNAMRCSENNVGRDIYNITWLETIKMSHMNIY